MEENNNMKIGVLTDSSSYLTKEQCEKYGIDVLPIPIIWDNKEYLDLIDIGFHEFYEKLSTSSTLPTTSQPSTGTVKKYVDKYIDQGYTDLIIITLSSGISSFYNNILSVADEESRINIHPFDCKITCAGEANAAILAGRLVKAGADIDLIMHDLKDLRNTTDVRFMVDNLNHLKRTGRLSNAASFVGSILKIKPILSKERHYKRAYNHIKKDFDSLTSDMPYPIQLTIFHADDEEREAEWVNDYESSFPKVKIYQSIIGPVVGVHVGQHTMAMIWGRDLDSYFDENGKPIKDIKSKVVED